MELILIILLILGIILVLNRKRRILYRPEILKLIKCLEKGFSLEHSLNRVCKSEQSRAFFVIYLNEYFSYFHYATIELDWTKLPSKSIILFLKDVLSFQIEFIPPKINKTL